MLRLAIIRSEVDVLVMIGKKSCCDENVQRRLNRVEEIELLHLLFRCLLLEKSRSLCYSLRLLLFAQRVTFLIVHTWTHD